MEEIRFSLLHASYKSFGQARKVRDYWLNRAKHPEKIEHCLGFEFSDTQVRDEFNLPHIAAGISPDQLTLFRATTPMDTPSAVRNWNAAASMSSGQILIGIADDLLPENGWDLALWEKISPHLEDIGLWKVNDSRCVSGEIKNGTDMLPRHPVITRKLYEKYGFYFNPRYHSVGPDDEWLLESLKNSFLRDAREIYFHHSIGPIFDDKGELQCGCFEKESPGNLTVGQTRMHQSNWKSLANENLRTWSLPWRVIGGSSVSDQIPDYIFFLIERFPGISASKIILRIILSPKINIKIRIKFIMAILKEINRR